MNDKKAISFCAGGIVGLLTGALIIFLVIRPSVDRIVETAREAQIRCSAVDEENRQLHVALDDNRVAGDVLIQQNKTLKEQANEHFSEATVLYEPLPAKSDMISSVAMLLGHPVPVVQGMAPRWFIPAKVKPIVYGDPRGMQLVYVDAQGRKEGPFAPGILPQ